MPVMARPVRYQGGVPVYRYSTEPETPPVSLMRFHAGVPGRHAEQHIHDFPALVYVVRAVPTEDQRFRDGDVFVLAAGAVIEPAMVSVVAEGCGVFFDPNALGDDGQAPWLSWRAHPLLFPFLHGIPGGMLRVHVPAERQPGWQATVAAIDTELAERADGYRQAVLAHLTLLLVDIARLADDVVGDLRRSNETLLAEVFDVIERRFAEPLSLRDVAASVGLTSGHLTTVVRQRTGRTVVDWITERRMVNARRLLADTDLPVGEIARRVGLPDPGYFARVFRQHNGITPREWRRGASR